MYNKTRLSIILNFICFGVIGCYLLWGNRYIFSDLEMHHDYALAPLYYDLPNMNSTDVIKISAGDLFEKLNSNDIDFYLSCTNHNKSSYNNLYNKKFQLKLRVDAFAILENNDKVDRLIKNNFYPSKEPMAGTSKIWAGWPDNRMEFLLGGMTVYPHEEQHIELTILEPDEIIANFETKLKITADYDRAVIGPLYLLRVIRDGLFIVALLCLWRLLIRSNRGSK